MATITRHAISWTVSDASIASQGTFANGDPWVVPTVPATGITITAISPGSSVSGGRTINGSMRNPTAGVTAQQGFDSASGGASYNSSLNVGLPGGSPVSGGNPLVVVAGSSLISSVSNATAGVRPQLTDASVLTVLSSAPSAGAFRPPYCGTDKTATRNKSSLNYGIFNDLTTVTGAPSQATAEGYLERLWIEINTNDGGRYIHPSNNQPDYGRDMADELAAVGMWLHLNNSDATKETAYVRLVQFGIDVYGAAVSGGEWRANGGHNQGRKMPMLLAGLALNDSSIIARADADTYLIFQEDQQTFVVDQDAIDITNGPTWNPDDRNPDARPYNSSDLGVPEWGLRHATEPNRDDASWSANYRLINFQSMLGAALVGNITTGMRAAWNWEVFFNYHDRAKSIQGNSSFSAFEYNMWNAYRYVGAPGGSSQAATPTFDAVVPGTYDSTQNVTIACSSPSPSIYYTIDGSAATTGSTAYVGAISVAATTRIRAIATSAGLTTSDELDGLFVISCVPPVFDPIAGAYGETQNVTITTTTSGASIYYTNDGSTPSASSTLYTSPVVVSANSTLSAIAIKSGLEDSTVRTAAYSIGGYQASEVWQEVALPIAYSDNFTVTFDAQVGTTTTDFVMGLSESSGVDAYTDLACIARMFSDGEIDARNGSAYAPTTGLAYSADVVYSFRLVINMTTNTYSIYVTPAGGSEETIGTGFSFRTEQSGVSSLGYFAFIIGTAEDGGTINNLATSSDTIPFRMGFRLNPVT